MSNHGDFSDIPVFHLHSPDPQRVPFVFNSPHSGRVYPERFLRQTRLSRTAIRRSEDAYVDELFSSVPELGAPFLTANFPRAWLDVNREPFELDPGMFRESLPAGANSRSARVAGGLGTVPRIVGEGLEIYSGPLPLREALERIEQAYVPYHACLQELLEQTFEQFGFAVLIDCHSMPASIRLGDHGHRPDFIIGDRFGTSASRGLSDHAIRCLSSMGYHVAYNRPYAGGFITEHYGRPGNGQHALQIEVNRGLYMNESNYEKSRGFGPVQQDLGRFCRMLLEYAEAGMGAPPLAAE